MEVKNATSNRLSPLAQDNSQDLTHSAAIQFCQKAIKMAWDRVKGTNFLCLAAGQALNELRDRLAHGEFENRRSEWFPWVSPRTLQYWQRAAEVVSRNIKHSALGSPKSVILFSSPDALSGNDLQYRNDFENWIEDKTIKDCLAAGFVGGDEDHHVNCVINGKLTGGTNRFDNRKNYAVFVRRGFKTISDHFSHFNSMTDLQRAEILRAVHAAIVGDPTMLSMRKAESGRGYMWPEEICRVLINASKERLNHSR